MSRPEKSDAKQIPSRWPKGMSGNPRGKPQGARHAALKALDAIGAAGAADIMAAVVKAAKDGDMRAAGLRTEAVGSNAAPWRKSRARVPPIVILAARASSKPCFATKSGLRYSTPLERRPS